MLFTLKSRLKRPAMERMSVPDIKKRMPAKSILLPVIDCAIPNSSKPSFISG